ncbi:uncharacterized protein LOC128548102 [Mercenaria mercenaria]|uniref:uncharacterized protein LOC128548102 n=1 Tax=Mercenaria mercenaria TaxID=6596 RepID=UPI00234F71B9|nr:uncharacterized protein LOC128548102 [Mercenaria mercenaria]
MTEYTCSQASQASSISTIPYEIFEPDFANELEQVDQLFFGNVLNSDSEGSISDEDLDESDDLNENSAPVHIDQSDCLPTDNEEVVKQNNFKAQGCGCVRLYGKPCSCVVEWSELIKYRQSCLEKSRDELDMIIKVQLYHNRNTGVNTERSKIREKNRQNYYFHGQKICRETFAFAHGVVHKTVDRIARSIDTDGLSARVHGNVGKSPKHALTLADTQNIKQFLVSYGAQNGLPLPGRMSNFRNEKYILLPSDRNEADIHALYSAAAEENAFRNVCLSEFKKIWLEQCPYLLIMKPSTDLCLKCQKYVQSIRNSGNLTEEQKLEKLHVYQDHIDKVKCQRDHYRLQVESTKQQYADLSAEEKNRGRCCTIFFICHRCV